MSDLHFWVSQHSRQAHNLTWHFPPLGLTDYNKPKVEPFRLDINTNTIHHGAQHGEGAVHALPL